MIQKTQKRIPLQKQPNSFLKKGRNMFFSTSGDTVVRGKKGIVKFFINKNEVNPLTYSRVRTIPITNHSAINYYASLMQQKPARNRDERIYGAPPPKTYIIRPVKLIKQTKKYHVVEDVKGPNLLDFLHFAELKKGPKMEKTEQSSQIKKDIEMRRKKLANFAIKHRSEIREWAKNKREFMVELFEQMDWIRGAGDGRVDIYKHELKETDFIVEGFKRGEDGKIKLKLVMVDFK
jgi:hypothetical protein